jgi:putative spermidine/putrescine transport system permease protein
MTRRRSESLLLLALIAPAAAVFTAFWLLPMARLAAVAGGGPLGLGAYAAIITNPRYLRSLIATLLLSAAVTAAALVVSGIAGLFLARNRFAGRSLLLAMLTFPLAFPGVVVGFMVIMLAGRQGLIGEIVFRLSGSRLVFAYSMAGLFLGYLYFSIPRVILTVMAAAERSLGAGRWRVLRDVLIPGLAPALISSGAICFATAMGAFGTAFTLATAIDVLPMTIYTEFTLAANVAMAASLSLVLGLITWLVLALARSAAGAGVAAAA